MTKQAKKFNTSSWRRRRADKVVGGGGGEGAPTIKVGGGAQELSATAGRPV